MVCLRVPNFGLIGRATVWAVVSQRDVARPQILVAATAT